VAAAPVDLHHFQIVTDGDPAFAQELVNAFISSGEQQLAEIAAALSQGDRAAVAKAAHKLKGACANIHAQVLKSVAERLESDSAAADGHALDQYNALLRREFDRVKAFLTDPSVVAPPTQAAS
jgi:HPt (histidine-containing phosphotransfer) domain-containing protein